jgi:hypothetical protein
MRVEKTFGSLICYQVWFLLFYCLFVKVFSSFFSFYSLLLFFLSVCDGNKSLYLVFVGVVFLSILDCF